MTIPQSKHITQYHDSTLTDPLWPVQNSAEATAHQPTVMVWVAENHRHNGLLWAQEDLARRTLVADAEIVANKRAIDKHNQARNDAIERMDEILLLELGLVSQESAMTNAPEIKKSPAARLNSETAGSMIDRLSILSLKIVAMDKQSLRVGASAQERAVCRLKNERLKTQRSDLAACFDQLVTDTQLGKAWFQIYRQFKMYNDPKLNPALQQEHSKGE